MSPNPDSKQRPLNPEVLEPAHLREAVAQEIAATAGIYGEEYEPAYEDDSQRGTS